MENEVEPGIISAFSAGAKHEYVRAKIFPLIAQN